MSSYSIDRLFDLRRKAEDDAAIALHRAVQVRAQAEIAHDSLKRAAARATVAHDAQRSQPAALAEAAVDAVGRHHYMERLAAAAQEAGRRVRAHQAAVMGPAQQMVEAAQQRYNHSRREREVVTQHRERARAAERLAAERREENERDDRGQRPPR